MIMRIRIFAGLVAVVFGDRPDPIDLSHSELEITQVKLRKFDWYYVRQEYNVYRPPTVAPTLHGISARKLTLNGTRDSMPKSKPRITLAGPIGSAISLNDKERAEIEKAYGDKLPPDAWKRVIATTILFAALAPSELSTPVKVILKKLKRLKDAAVSLMLDLSTEPPMADAETTSLSLENIEKKYFRGSQPKSPTSPVELFDVLINSVNAVIDTSEYALTHLADENELFNQSLPEGTFWALWVTDIEVILKQNGLPTGVRKDFVKDKGPSKFVIFIFELQKHIPVESRRHMPAENAKNQKIYLDALSQAIYRARRSYPSRDTLFSDAFLS